MFFKYCSRFEIGFNSPETVAYKRINPSDQVINENSSETSNLDNMTNEVPPKGSYDAKTKNMKMSVLYDSN